MSKSKSNTPQFTERSSELDAIKEIVNAIGATSDPLPIILEQIGGLFSSNYGAIGLFSPETREITFYAIWENGTLLTGDDIPADKRSISGQKSIQLHVATSGQAHRSSDVSDDFNYREWYSETRSELTVPLKDSYGNVIGVLNLESATLGAFSQTDEDLCQGLANVISSVIEKSNLLSTNQKMNRQIELLHRVVSEQNLQKVLTLLLEGLNEIMGEGASSSINLYSEAGDSLYNIFAIGELAEYLRVSPRPNGTCRYVVKTREPIFVDDTQSDFFNPPDRPTLRKEAVTDAGIKSFAALPLIRNENVLGVVFIHQMNQVRFTQEVRQVLETFASQAAVAIENSRLYSELQEVVNQSAVPTFVIDSRHIVTHWNKACEELTGVRREDIVGTNKLWKAFYRRERELFPNLIVRGASEDEIKKLYKEKLKRSKLIEGAYEFQTRFMRPKDGSERWLYFTAAPLRDASGNTIGAIETTQDITEQKLAEGELQALLSAIPDLVIVYDKQGYYVEIGATSPPQYLYKPAEEMIGKKVDEVLPKQQAEICLGAIQESLKERRIVRLEYGLNIKGKDIWFDARVVPMTDDNRVVFVARDITERKEAEDRRINDIVALQEINNAVVSQPAEVLGLIVEKAVSVIPAEYASLWLADPESGDLVLEAIQGPREEIQLPSDHRLHTNEPSDQMKVFQTGKYLICNDVEKESRYFKRLYQAARSELIVPMRYRDKIIGTLNVESQFRGAFSLENVTLLESFAAQAAIAIENANLYNQLNIKVRNLEAVIDVFVLMPFAKEYRLFYEKEIKKTIEKMGLTCKRADDFYGSRVIMRDIYDGIKNAKFILADFSGRNPNVFFEVGIAHALGKRVIQTTQNLDDVPPKLQVVRCLVYEKSLPGAKKFVPIFEKAIRETQEDDFPPLFTKKDFKVKHRFCFALVPSNKDGRQLYNDLLVEALKDTNCGFNRSGEIFNSNSILDEIWAQLNKAEFVISDLTGRDPDVFYLSGIAYGLGKKVIYIAQDMNDVPFDLKEGSCMIYSIKTYEEGIKAKEKLTQLIDELLQQ